MYKQKGNGLVELMIFIVVLVVLLGISRCSRPELYDEAIDFQSQQLKDNKIEAQIEYLKWYDNDDVTDYYVFTNYGKLNIDAKDYGWWNGDEKMYDDLEDYVGQTCTFEVESSWLYDWQATRFYDCKFE